MLGELEHLPQDLDSLIFNSLSRKMTGVEDCTCTDTCWNIFPLLDLWAMPVTWIIVGPRHVSECEGLLNQETLLPLFRNFLIWCSGPDRTISVRATAGRATRTSGRAWTSRGSEGLVYYEIIDYIINAPSRGSEEERRGIPCWWRYI